MVFAELEGKSVLFIIFGQYLSKLDAKNDGKKLCTTNRAAFLCMEVKLAYTHTSRDGRIYKTYSHKL